MENNFLGSPEVVAPRGKRGHSELLLRIASALVLAPFAFAVAYWGGFAFALFWATAALLVLWEWGRFFSAKLAQQLVAIGAAALMATMLAIVFDRPGDIALISVAALVLAGVLTRGLWGPAGLVYAGSLIAGTVLLRGDPEWGLAAILVLFAVNWGTDIAAYCGGRLIGGPKLWARVSPNKTWSGGLVGAAVAAIAGTATGWFFGVANLAAVALLSIVLSIVSQAGDFLESAFKRNFGAKDSSHLIPGHGGLMDRLDGFITAVALAALIGVARGGFEAPSRGLLIW